jgi:hypothetical protein
MKIVRGQCGAFVRYGTDGPIAPRQCRHPAKKNGFCALHAPDPNRPYVVAADGGWCVWCGEPARRYQRAVSGLSLAICLCARCGEALGQLLLLEHRARVREKRKNER